MAKEQSLNPVKFGLAAGILTAICVFFTVIFGMLGWFSAYADLSMQWLIAIYGFLGVRGLNFVSAVLGAIYGFIDMFIGCAVFAWLYNKLLR